MQQSPAIAKQMATVMDDISNCAKVFAKDLLAI